MIRIGFILFAIGLLGCRDDSEIDKVNFTGEVIDHIIENWDTTYFVYEEDILVEIQDQENTHLIRRDSAGIKELVLEYNEIRVILESLLIHRDSLSRVESIDRLLFSSDKPRPDTLSFRFYYDDVNRLKEVRLVGSNDQAVTKSIFLRENGNIVQGIFEWDSYDYKAIHRFSFDDRPNLTRQDPRRILEPHYYNTNNILSEKVERVKGNIRVVCENCLYEYQYNQSDYPVLIQRSWDDDLIVCYK